MAESDWGFPSLVKRSQFFTEEPGKRFVIDDAMTVSVFVKIVKDEFGTLWHNFHKCDDSASRMLRARMCDRRNAHGRRRPGTREGACPY